MLKRYIKIQEKICPVCGKTFTRKSTSGKRYCSEECREKANNYNRTSERVWKRRRNKLRKAKNKLSPELVNEGYKYIRAAIVQQAVDDLIKAYADDNKGAAMSLERWFLSEWGQALSDNNGEKIIERLRKERKKAK